MAHFKNRFFITPRPRAELLTIGTELVRGSVVNTNAAYLGRELTKLGFDVRDQVACPDDAPSIKNALRVALSRADVILVSGGLGPTPDDITRETLAEYFQSPLVFSEKQYQLIQQYYRKRGRSVPSLVKREACLPSCAKPILNQFGVALGFSVEERGHLIVAVPGVPGELTRLFEHRLKAMLRQRFPALRPFSKLIVKTIGLSEPDIMHRLGPSFFGLGLFQFGIYPEIGEVGLMIYADSPKLIKRLKRHIEEVLGPHIYSFSEEPIEAVIGKILRAKRHSIAVAESCTGGKISAMITKAAGASRYFLGGVVPYHDQTKIQLLDIPQDVLSQKGAVSGEIASSMAQEVRKKFKSTFGMGITGIAGPTGGTQKKPVGLVYIALASSKNIKIREEHFLGDRIQIQARAAKKALEYLWRCIR